MTEIFIHKAELLKKYNELSTLIRVISQIDLQYQHKNIVYSRNGYSEGVQLLHGRLLVFLKQLEHLCYQTKLYLEKIDNDFFTTDISLYRTFESKEE